jgi:hypothetical protein
MDAVKVHRVGMRSVVPERYAYEVAFGGAQRRAGNASVIGPGREEHAWENFDLLVLTHDLEVAQCTAVGQARDTSHFPIGQHCRWIKAIFFIVDLANRKHMAVNLMAGSGRVGRAAVAGRGLGEALPLRGNASE